MIEGTSIPKDRIIGLHYFIPASTNPILEIVRTKHVSPQILADCIAFAKKTKKLQ